MGLLYVSGDNWTSMHLVLHALSPSPCKAHAFVLACLGNRIVKGGV